MPLILKQYICINNKIKTIKEKRSETSVVIFSGDKYQWWWHTWKKVFNAIQDENIYSWWVYRCHIGQESSHHPS